MFAYISQNGDKRIFEALKQEGFGIIPLAPFSALSHPVDTHADMLLLTVDNVVFVHKDYRETDLSSFKQIIKIDEPMGNKYPNDILFNIAVVGKNAFTNTKFASKTVLKYLWQNGFAIHHVEQGYSHCSTCIVSENAIISADIGIVEAAKNVGIEALKIDEGYISLPPYNYGFIGGASGAFESKIYFCGSLDYHPNGQEIRKFCELHGKRAIDLFNAPLLDIGGILFK